MRRFAWLTLAGSLVALGTACDSESAPSNGRDADAPESGKDEDREQTDGTDHTDDEEVENGSAGEQKQDGGKPKLDSGASSPSGTRTDGGRDAGSGAGASLDGGAAGGAGSDGGEVSADASDSANGPSSGTFPSVSDPAAKGPFNAKTVNNTGPDGAYTLYYPEPLATEGLLHPLVSWGNGGATTPVDYPMLPHLATHGFVVIASNNPLVQGTHVRAGIDWLVEQNDDLESPLHQKLDTDNISGVGYSNGGLATLAAADDPRFVTLVIISGASTSESARMENIPRMHSPTAYLCTDDDASENNCKADYDVVKVPAFFGVMNGSTHVSVTEFLGLGDAEIIGRMHHATTAWLRWHQMNDLSFKPLFVGADCGLCTDEKWTVHPQKSLE